MLKLKNQSGMTLVEVILVMLILSIALIPIFKVFTLNLQSLANSQQKITALLKAQEILEYKKAEINSLEDYSPSAKINYKNEDGLKSEVYIFKKNDLYTIDVKVFDGQHSVHLISKTGDYYGQ